MASINTTQQTIVAVIFYSCFLLHKSTQQKSQLNFTNLAQSAVRSWADKNNNKNELQVINVFGKKKDVRNLVK